MTPHADTNVHENEKAFEQEFHQGFDSKTEKEAAEALKQSEEEINKNNADYNKGKSTFWEKLSKFSDIPLEDFEKTEEGGIEDDGDGRAANDFATGLLGITEEEKVMTPEMKEMDEEKKFY